ncbi:ABR023Cp [Eremothecium gossypii ATCC 10895]|uniref:ABR023Cp n=1 Tax=Eremothecium gossypii (strain ATCC 10895 / CBS 109.51 / FGSC 9923 / NRRL Y-1056) TaxID=284811 RepID=Q75DJ9_EREGS|nr:ABR023Cp [Eremothecium gossypii ATCC 10895]AAS50793.1 ABR023Cp [Eremothecium gossypii ATCC 10895]AEY95082.1 FABR023Cp [Eremothecium gossypii FDAG1]
MPVSSASGSLCPSDSAGTMVPNIQKAQEAGCSFRLHSPQQSAAAETCQCRNGMRIFERSVEESCADVWDSDTSEEERSDAEDDALGDEACAGGRRARAVRAHSGASSALRQTTCARCHKLRAARSAHDEQGQRPRTNSIILQLSRQTTRQSFLDSAAPGHGDSADDAVCHTKSRSSFSAIPTHIYSLERYISAELDSATESFFDTDVKLADTSATNGVSSVASPNFPSSSASISMSLASLSSASNFNDKLSPPPVFLDQRKRRKSHIELALSESFQ